jgi:excisionase family DNA binding protein
MPQEKLPSILQKSYDYREAAEALRLSYAHLRKLVSQRKIPFTKVGGKVLFSESQLLSICREVLPTNGE